MPTGYTTKLMEKGQSFESFVLDCARAFGVCFDLREESMDIAIPKKFKPSNYHLKELKKDKEELAKLKRLTPKQQLKKGQQLKQTKIREYTKWYKNELEENQRLNDMRIKVREWNPPTNQHRGLKRFMLQQIKISLNDLGYVKENIKESTDLLPKEYFQKKIQRIERSIKYNKKEHREEVGRIDGRNKWIADLRKSLKEE